MKDKIKGIPNKIYLVIDPIIFDDLEENKILSFYELSNISWCSDRINNTDIEYNISDLYTPDN